MLVNDRNPLVLALNLKRNWLGSRTSISVLNLFMSFVDQFISVRESMSL